AFVVECDGSVGAVEVLQAPDKSLAAEVVRVIESVPAGSWAPGMQQGEPVRVKYIVPVDFKMSVPETPEPASEK
ncbi:MAG: energy transducer TonB, partial [Alistipes sp.]|nr:energy transducer TonB [Alistipes sp.]